MNHIEFQPSGLASLPVVQRVRSTIGEAVTAVESYMGEEVPPLTIVVAGRPGMATASVLAAGWRGSTLRHAAAHWLNTYQHSKQILAYTSATRTGRALVALNATALKRWEPEQVRLTLIHELVHTIQLSRTGRHREEQTILDNDLRIAGVPTGRRHVHEALIAIEEAEAYAVEDALDPETGSRPLFDREEAARLIHQATDHWKNAIRAREE